MEKTNNVSLPYNLTQYSESDLKEIARDTLKRWGKKQTAIYARKLDECFYNIAEEKVISRSFSKRFPQVKSVKCEHHYVFYIQQKDSRPIIIGVLYEHMDILTRIANRLSNTQHDKSKTKSHPEKRKNTTL